MATAVERTPSEQRGRLMIAGAVLFAAIAAVLVFIVLQNRGGDDTAAAAATADVVVASQAIGVNTKLEEGMLELKAVPVDQALTGAYGEIERAVGLPVRYPLQQGEQITVSKVGVNEIEEEKDLGFVLEDGERAFSVSVQEVTGVGGLLLAGNFVDVFVVWTDDTAVVTEDDEAITKAAVLLENIEVLSVAQEAQEPIPAAAPVTDDADAAGAEAGAIPEDEATSQGARGQRPEEIERQPGARTVTFRVTPQQALLLSLLQGSGDVDAKLWLALRSNGDDAAAGAPGIDWNQFKAAR